MREKRTFGQRTNLLATEGKLVEGRKGFFLVFEGDKTEEIYFTAMEKLKGEIGISPLIELIPIEKSYSERNWSNPKKIVDRVLKDLDDIQNGIVNYETLLNYIVEYLSNNEKSFSQISKEIIWNCLKDVCNKNLKVNLNDSVDNMELQCEQILHFINERLEVELEINSVKEKILAMESEMRISYDKDFDIMCLIVDRDKGSFFENTKSNQYQYVVKRCQENNFKLCVTNPCFEFWLLMHYDEVLSLDRDKILKNEKITTKKRFTEYELKKLLKNYKKSKYDAEELIRKMDIAIKNEKSFCEDIFIAKHVIMQAFYAILFM